MSEVRWEPLQPGEPVDYDMTIGSNSELRVVTELGEMVVEFDDDIRLCRAVPDAEWSQEPPDAPGDWWCWRPGYKAPDLWRVSEYADAMNMRDYWEVRRNGVSISMQKSGMGNIGWWYMRATVPQPPGEEVTP